MNVILIIEDEEIIRSALCKLLTHSGYQVSVAESVQEALDNFQFSDFDLIITDLRLPGRSGTDVIDLAKTVPVLIMTSYASLRSAVDVMKKGAVDYIAKPFDHDEMLVAVRQILRTGQRPSPARSNTSGSAVNTEDSVNLAEIIYGQCPAMQKVFNILYKVAPSDTTVLIQGESGTGKELAAQALHRLSKRTDKPMICVNCAAIPESLIESELFGHERGAFTGAIASRNGLIEAADKGTLFLDEIGELPMEAQARLLRVLQEGEVRKVGSTQSKKVNVRLIAATHRNLKTLTQNKEFREDLYYRLNVMLVKLPPLRDRGSDILQLAKKLLLKIQNKMSLSNMSLSPEAMQAIEQYDWPGNVRELENALERAVVLCENGLITLPLLDISSSLNDMYIPEGLITPSSGHNSSENRNPLPKELSLEDYFQHFVLENQDRMSETELAQKLGISRKSLWERRQRLGIPRKKSSTSNS